MEATNLDRAKRLAELVAQKQPNSAQLKQLMKDVAKETGYSLKDVKLIFKAALLAAGVMP